jgi:hypothetical protein
VELHDKYLCRTLDDVSEHYRLREDAEWSEGVVGEGVPLGTSWQRVREGGRERRRSRNADKRRREGRMSQAEVVREWIALRDEIDQKWAPPPPHLSPSFGSNSLLPVEIPIRCLQDTTIRSGRNRPLRKGAFGCADAWLPVYHHRRVCGGSWPDVVFCPSLTLPASSRYRRGKPESNDVDIVFCPPEDGKDVGLLHDLYMRMGDLGGC